MSSEFTIRTSKENRAGIIDRLAPLGDVTTKWRDGSFDFQPFDEECSNKMEEVLDSLGVEYTLA